MCLFLKLLPSQYASNISMCAFPVMTWWWTKPHLGFSSCRFCAFWPPALGGRTAPSCRWEPTDAPSSCQRGRDLEYESLLDGTWGRWPAGEAIVEGEEKQKGARVQLKVRKWRWRGREYRKCTNRGKKRMKEKESGKIKRTNVTCKLISVNNTVIIMYFTYVYLYVVC